MTATDPAAAKPPDAPPSLWRNRDFNLLWGGLLLSNLGGSMAALAFPLVVLALGGSAVTAGLVGTVALGVQLVCNVPSGVLVDRVDRRRLIVCCDLVRLAAFLGLGVALLTGDARIWLVLVVAMIEAACEAPVFSAVFASVRNLVPAGQVQDAMARNEARNHAVTLVGPPLGGLALSLGRSVPFLANAVSYAFSLTAALLIRTPLQEAHGTKSTSPLRDVLDGLRFVATTPFVRSAVLIGAPLNLALNGTMFGIVLVLRENGVAPAVIGLAESLLAVGGLLGALVAGWVLRRVSVGVVIRVIPTLAVPLLLLVWPLASSPLAAPLVALPVAVLALGFGSLNAGMFGHLAAVVPDQMQGRVMSALFVSVMSLTSIAPVGAGLLVEHLGAAGLGIGSAAVMAVSAVTALTSRGIREID